MNLQEKVLTVIESLKKEENAIILVEGTRDIIALQKLGICHPIKKVSGKKILDDISFLKGKNIIILTDFDRTGRKLFKKLRIELEVMGFKPNLYYWQTLNRLITHKMTQIEELSQFAHQSYR
jgi:5S rRNA maturation endonuclease (ribonuclease M5)